MKKKMLILAAFVAAAATAQAEPAGFDSTAFTSQLEGAVAAAIPLCVSLAGLTAGLMAWGKIAKYFQRTR